MTSPNEYRDFARECMQMAERAKNPEVKKTLIEMARLWMNTACEVERSFALIDDDSPSIVPKGQKR